MAVNEVPQEPPKRRTQAERSSSTRDALLVAGRALFAEEGFANAGQEDIVERAGVTRGALSYHFGTKRGLFEAVMAELHAELTERIVTASMKGTDPMDELRLGCLVFLDAAMDPAYGRIVLVDAPAVLGWRDWREMDAEHGLGLVSMALENAMTAGLIDRRPVQPLAHLLLATLNEAAMLVADSRDPVATRAEIGETVEGILRRL